MLLEIINDILDLSKIEAGKLELESLPFDLGQLVESVVKLFGATTQKKGLLLAYRIDPALERWWVGDAVRIRQVLMNLLSNAIKFTSSGEIRVDVSPYSDGGIRIAVDDTGIGMSQRVQREIFEPFSQADQSTSRHYGGTGLGLAICHQLVEKMGGRIGVKSEEGVGSRFAFHLPLVVAPAPERGSSLPRVRPRVRVDLTVKSIADSVLAFLAYPGVTTDPDRGEVLIRDPSEGELPGYGCVVEHVASRRHVALSAPVCESALMHALEEHAVAEKRSGPGKRCRILVVEDDPIGQFVVKEMARGMGHEVVVAGTCAEARHILSNKQFELTLLDWELPDGDGLSLAVWLRRSVPKPGRIIALTAHSEPEVRRRSEQAGLDGFIAKPVSRNELDRVIRNLG